MGTIPIRRILKQELLNATSLAKYGRKNPYVVHSNRSTIRQETNKTHAFNFLYKNGTSNFLNGTSNNLYVNRSADGSHTTGCFDLTCTGFVQTNHEVALGSPIEPVSSEFGPQYEIAIFIFMDVNTSNWWLLLNHKEVGYWPGELFVLLRGSAKVVQFGGEVYSETIGKEGVKHTSTAMGSGGDARDMYTGAAYIHHVRIIDYSLTEKYPEWVMEYMDEPYCYSAYNYVQYIKEPEFYFGGHGSHWNPYCQ
ncbi:hypothetical protein MKW92_024277 [Papaver armeniacum]|nr:hypothetical protein MKW92_024277 [Papaver armeniacum]